jgi:hypothetical protein
MMLGGVPALFRWVDEHLLARIGLPVMVLLGDNGRVPLWTGQPSDIGSYIAAQT